MEVAVGWATMTVLEVSGSDGKGGGGKGGSEVIAPSLWGWVAMSMEGGGGGDQGTGSSGLGGQALLQQHQW